VAAAQEQQGKPEKLIDRHKAQSSTWVAVDSGVNSTQPTAHSRCEAAPSVVRPRLGRLSADPEVPRGCSACYWGLRVNAYNLRAECRA
jgi:hypothetical protein